jgi:hypothetical protein
MRVSSYPSMYAVAYSRSRAARLIRGTSQSDVHTIVRSAPKLPPPPSPSLDRQGLRHRSQAVLEANNEATGDFIIYFNTTANVGSLLFVDALDTAHSIARFANIGSLADLQAADFDAGDFLFA